MKTARLRQKSLVCGIALALWVPGAALAQGQQAENPAQSPATASTTGGVQDDGSKKNHDDTTTLTTIQVTGVRASLARSVGLKRNASTVQDSITALELGKFPDDNVADSLSHITGVAISRTAGGEGQKVSVRGLGPEYTLTTFNNRILATDGSGRDFAFDVLPSDVIIGADVIKGAEASLTEGAIGGLVNLRSGSAFDQPGQRGAVRLEGDHNQMSELNGHKLSAAYSNTFANNTFGVMAGLVYAKRHDRTDVAGNDGGWTRNPDPNDPSWYGNAWGGNIDLNGNGILDPNEYGLIGPGQFRVGSILEDKKRLALSGSIEWRPTDSLHVKVDGLKTRLNSPQIGYQQSFYPLFSPGRWSDMTVKNGIVTGLTLDNPDPELRLNPELLNTTDYRVVDTALFGANVAWQVTPDFNLIGDVYRSTSRRHSGGQDSYVVLRMNQPNVTRIELTGYRVPDVTTTFADGRDLSSGLANGEFGPSDFNTHYFQLGGDNIDDRINGASLGGNLFVDKFHVDDLKFGINFTDRRKARDLVDNTVNGGADYYSGQYAINVGDLGGNVLSHRFTLPNFMSGVHSNFPRSFMAFDIPGYLAALRAYNGKPRPGGGSYEFSAAAPAWNPLQSYRVSERTFSTYFQADMSGEHWDGNIGVRLVKTDTTSQAWDAKILSITENGAFNYTAKYADPTPITQKGDYTFVLPSANFVWHFTDKLQLRLGAAKTMARPSVEQLAPTSTTQSVSWGEFTQVFGGNVNLKPYSARQGDASLEWYFDDKSIFNLAVFQKRIENQITTSFETGQDIGVGPILDPNGNPVTSGPTLFNVVRPINGDYAKVHGVEVGLQHFWKSGFGFRMQYTRNWSESWVDGQKRPLEGIAPSVYSVSLMYEKGPWSIGATADHTNGFVTAIGVLGNGYNELADPLTWLTAHVSYEINDQFSISLEGQNLLDEAQTYSINGNPLLSEGYFRYGRSVTLGVRFKF